MDPQIAANLAVAQKWVADGKLDDASAMLREIVSAGESLEPLHLLGVIAFEQKRYGEAVEHWQKAVALEPGNGERQYLIGMALSQVKKWAQAIAALRRAIELDADLLEAYVALAEALAAEGDSAGAIVSCRDCLKIDPTFAEAHLQLGVNLLFANEIEEACAEFLAAIEHADGSNDPQTLRSRAQTEYGFAMIRARRDAEAIAAFDRSITISPAGSANLARAHFFKAMARLRTGDYAAGFREYEWRWQTSILQPLVRKFSQPAWDGSDLDGRTILLCGEQGHGDAIQFIRFAREVAERKGGRVVATVKPTLRNLVATCPGVSAAVGDDQAPPAFDVWANLMSLPMLLGIKSPEEVPARVPYLSAAAGDIEAWRARLPAKSGVRRVGLVWAGATAYTGKSIPLHELMPLASVKGIELFSLQVGERAADIAAERFAITDLSSHLTDYAQTGAAIECLDLIISVDTAVAHLGGAMAKPTWTLLAWSADWRWGEEGEATPWYPGMRLFRQSSAGAWGGVVGRLVEALREWMRP